MKKGSIVIIFLFICLNIIYAMPPRPGLELPPTDYEEMARLGINVSKNPVRDAGKKGIINTPGDVVPLVSGSKKFPTVFIKYTDYANIYPVASFDSMLYSDNWLTSGSAKNYYSQISYGVFTLQGSCSGWYTSDSVKAWYGYSNGFQRAAILAKEAAAEADASVNYAQFDNDGDGYVDCFTCIHSGYGREETGSGTDIHSHSWDFYNAGIGDYTTNDPDPVNGGYIKIREYVMDPERSSASNHGTMVSIGVFCHEWGHALGLPDLYDTDGGGEGIGNWCLMAGGSWGGNGWSPYYPVQMCAWAKMHLGWLNPTAIRRKDLYTIPQVENNSKAYWLIGRQRTFKEYFLIENRQKILSDINLYNSGLLIYHIDDSICSAGYWNTGGGTRKYGVALEQADGLDSLYYGGDRGNAGDPYPGSTNNRTFDTTSTNPNSKTNYPMATPLVTGSFVKNIPNSSSVMACTLSSGVVGQFTGGPDASTYRWIDSDTTGGPTYNWIDISATGTALGTGDDARYWFKLPFNFKFYGTNYDTVWVCTNGWLSFGINPGSSAWTNATVPTATVPNRAIFVFWDDMDVVSGDNSNMYYQTFGSAPSRYCVITWKDVERRNSPYSFNQMTFQAILYEDGQIVLQYKDCSVGDSTYNWGKSATVGIENSAGTVGLQYLYNGSPNGNLLASERAIKFYPTIVDVGVTAIEIPTGSIDSTGALIKPRARVKNFGTDTTTFSVTMKIGSYSNTRTKKLNADVEDTVNFADWFPVPGNYTVRCSTARINDIDFTNDTLSGSVVVTRKNIGVTAIENPISTIDSTSIPIIPRAKVKNYGSNTETFNVNLKVLGTSYNQTRSKTLGAGVEDTVNFVSWIPIRGTYTTRCSVYLAADVVRNNDTLDGSVTVQVKDVGVTAIENPVGTIDSNNTTIIPRARVKNNGTGPETFNVVYKIGSTYTSSRAKTLGAGIEDTVNFASWIPVRGTSATRCSVALASDVVRTNDTLSGSVTVQVKDVGVTAIDMPSGTLDSTGSIIPLARVKNYGTSPATFFVAMRIGYIYSNFRMKTLPAGAEDTVNFIAWQPMRGACSTRCVVFLTNDVVPRNDTLDGSCFIKVYDIGVFGITQPTGIIDTANIIIPKATVKNYGNETESFNAVFMIPGTKWASIKPVTNLLPDSISLVEFNPWTIEPRGNYTTKCSTYLATDMVLNNNTMNDSFKVQVKDYAVTLVSEPFNPVDSGSVALPKAVVHNFGSTDESDVLVTLYIEGTSYTSTKNISLVSGDSAEVAFDSVTANFTRGNYTMRCTTNLIGDAVENNNWATREFSVRIADVTVLEIVQPIDTIDSISGYVPIVKVKNLGTHPENFNVFFAINETGWSSVKAVEDLDANQEQLVEFDAWTIGPRGNYNVKCSTRLVNDMYQDNDKLEGVFTVRVDTIAPEPPILIPFADSIYDNTPKFVWNDVGDVDTFNLVISSSAKDELSFNTTETTYTLLDPIANGIYSWKVRGRDLSGNWSEFSDSLQFTIISPAMPILISPLNNDTINTRVPAFIWHKSEDSDSFNLVYTGPSKDEISVTTYDTTYTPAESLSQGNYFWKVRAQDEYGNFSDYSDEWSFMLDATGPDAPILISPINSVIINNEMTEFIWSVVADANLYRIVITQIPVNISEMYYASDSTLTITLGKGTYNWKVQGRDNVGNWGQFSDIGTFSVTVTWVQKEQIINPADGKTIKDGGALVGVGANLYAFRGTKTNEFKMYSTETKSGWTDKTSIPFGLKPLIPLDPAKFSNKFPGKGAALCFDGNNTIYATRGNNTKEFWSYNISANTWKQESFVPVPKGLKGGTSIQYYNGKVYLLAGYQKKTDLYNFFGFDTVTRLWSRLHSLELGINIKVWKDGSSIALIDSLIYALKGGDKTNLFYAYNINSDIWMIKEEMPIAESLYGKYKKKLLVKDGGAMTTDGENIYAIKGGGANVFWKYTPGAPGIWSKLDTIPRLHKKSVPKTGASLAYADEKVWLLKGNKTPEFWCFILPLAKEEIQNQIVNRNIQEHEILHFVQNDILFNVVPNPFTKQAVLQYNVLSAGKVSLKLYNADGRLIQTLIDEYQNAGSYSLEIDNASEIPSGIYFVKYESNNKCIANLKIIRR